jgi:hypothetical protein
VKTSYKTIVLAGINAVLFIIFALSAKAQKQNAVQEGGVRAPANVKVDAKATEWNDTYQAFNKATDIYYTMANDDANLYLIIKSANQVNNNKILGGGISITINTDNKKKQKDAFVIGFPVVDPVNLRAQVMQGMRSRMGGGGQQGPDSAAIANMRKQAVSAAKEIKLIGFKDVTDSVISIYNEYGIKARADFDNKGSLIVEMAIPLKYFPLGGDGKFAYNIKLNGIQIDAIFPGASAMMAGGGPGGGGFGGGGGGFGGGGGMPQGGGVPRGMSDMASMISPTDFWGNYTLAKK